MHARTLLFIAALLPSILFADESVLVAVASNFAQTAAELANDYSQESGVPVKISSGSTGKLYAQMINGAPFDVFLAADKERPRMLEQQGHAVSGSRFTYAIGALAIWSRDEKLRGRDCREVLERGDFERLALANPKTAPYGAAAQEFMIGAGLWGNAEGRAVFGENIAQALQFVATGNVTLGFVAMSQLGHRNLPPTTCQWRVPESLYTSLDQQAVLLKRAEGSDGARRFMEYLRTDAATEIITRRGYGVSH